jgi:hypothetical protein
MYSLNLRVTLCNQTALSVKYNNTKTCAPYTDQIFVASSLEMDLLIENSYFVQDDYSDNPIRKYLKYYRLTSFNQMS